MINVSVYCQSVDSKNVSSQILHRICTDLSHKLLNCWTVFSIENTVQDCCSDIWLCPRRWSWLFQASCPSSLWSVMSVTPFYQPRRLVRFAGKHVHRPTKFFYRGSCCLERTSTRHTLTAHQSPTVPIKADKPTTLHDSSENNLLKSETL